MSKIAVVAGVLCLLVALGVAYVNVGLVEKDRQQKSVAPRTVVEEPRTPDEREKASKAIAPKQTPALEYAAAAAGPIPQAENRKHSHKHGIELAAGPQVRVIEGIVLDMTPAGPEGMEHGIDLAGYSRVRFLLGSGLSEIYLGHPPKELTFLAKDSLRFLVKDGIRPNQKVWLKVQAEPRVHCGGSIADYGLTLLDIKPQSKKQCFWMNGNRGRLSGVPEAIPGPPVKICN